MAEKGKRFHFRAPPSALLSLTSAKIKIVGVANNHALDFGPAALLDSIAQLRQAGLTVVGDGATTGGTCAPRYFTTSEQRRIGVLAASDLARSGGSGMIAFASDRERWQRAIEKTRAESDFVIMLMHWGEENSSVVTEKQRELARWLIDHGVDLIAGSHPHCRQPLDFYHGRAIVYSLGNLVFDGATTVPGWNTGQLLEVGFTPGRATPSLQLVPVKLDGNGFPHLAQERELASASTR